MPHSECPEVGARLGAVATADRPAVRRRRAVPVVVCVLVVAVLAPGCARSRAAEVVAGPPLSVPAPPPRVIAPAEEAPLAAGPGRADTPLAGAPEVVQERATVPPSPRPAAPVRPEQPAASTTSPTPSANTPVAELPRQVQIESSGGDAAQRKTLDGFLSSAQGDLNRISADRLSAQDRQQYDDASSLLSAARKAASERNFTNAILQAEKAAKIAAALVR